MLPEIHAPVNVNVDMDLSLTGNFHAIVAGKSNMIFSCFSPAQGRARLNKGACQLKVSSHAAAKRRRC
jgi:hypothetical protein